MKITLILYNGCIYTMDGRKEEAIAVSNDKIVKVGKSSEILLLQSLETEVIDLKDKVVLPGFIDTHTHLVGYGCSLNSVNLENSTSKTEIIDRCKDFILKNHIPEGSWIYGRGWNQNLFINDHTFPTKEDLDKISEKHPILLIRTCGHVGIANSYALNNVGITSEIFIEGGQFGKDSQGNLNGVITEASLEWFKKMKSSKQSLKEIKKAIVDGCNELLKYGVTSIHTEDSYDLGYAGDFKDIYNTYQELIKENKLPLRIYQKISLPNSESINEFFENSDLRTGMGDEYYKIGPVKQWTDGTLGARTAALLEDYSDDKGNKGIFYYTEEELYENVKKAHCNGMQVCLHAIGDGALEMVLNAYERVLNEHPKQNHRHRIVHCFVGNIEQYKKIAKLDLIINTQPISTSTDISMMNDRVGSIREKSCHAWNTLTDMGVIITGSSDIPVETPNVFHGIYAVVNRKNINGKPSYEWMPEEKLSLEEALKIVTINGAYSSFEDDIKGTITEGKLADMVVVSENPFEVPLENIKDIVIEKTIVGGQMRYSS